MRNEVLATYNISNMNIIDVYWDKLPLDRCKEIQCNGYTYHIRQLVTGSRYKNTVQMIIEEKGLKTGDIIDIS